MTEREIYKRAVNQYGIQNQLDQLQEECAEAIVAVSHVRRASSKGEAESIKAFDELAEEIADVEIMCAQARLCLGGKAVESMKRHKLKRLEKRLKEAKEPA